MRPPCSIEGCPNVTRYGDLCDTHRRRIQVHGDPLVHVPIAAWGKPSKAEQCIAEGCQKKGRVRGRCLSHHRLWEREQEAKRRRLCGVCGGERPTRKGSAELVRNVCAPCMREVRRLTGDRLAAARLVEVPDSWDDAACRDHPGDWWFASDDASTAWAKAVCSTCPLVDECFSAGVGEVGVWGGLTDRERTAWARRVAS